MQYTNKIVFLAAVVLAGSLLMHPCSFVWADDGEMVTVNQPAGTQYQVPGDWHLSEKDSAPFCKVFKLIDPNDPNQFDQFSVLAVPVPSEITAADFARGVQNLRLDMTHRLKMSLIKDQDASANGLRAWLFEAEGRESDDRDKSVETVHIIQMMISSPGKNYLVYFGTSMTSPDAQVKTAYSVFRSLALDGKKPALPAN